jgi:hypothetical protein
MAMPTPIITIPIMKSVCTISKGIKLFFAKKLTNKLNATKQVPNNKGNME